MREEFKRQGVSDDEKLFRPQKCWDTREGSNIWETYPFEVYVPYRMTPSDVSAWAKFRTKRRFPALSFYYQAKKSALFRSSQNMPGIMSRRSEEDENMLSKIGRVNPNTSSISIYDARSKVKAYSNWVKGGGWENTDYYK